MKISEQQLLCLLHYIHLFFTRTISIDGASKAEELYNKIMNQQSRELKDVE